MPKAAKAAKLPKARPKTFEDVFVAKPEHDHCKQVLASKRIRDCCFTGWDTTREPYFPQDKGCYYMAANLELCPTTGREHWQGIACFNTVQPAGKVRGMLGQPTAHVGQRVGELSDCIAYCTKLDSRKPGTEPVIMGQPRCLKQVKGERSDLNRAREIIQEHKTWTQVINDRTLCDVLARHPRWAHDVFENRAAKPVDESTSLQAFADWQHDVLLRIGCGIETVEPGDKALWFHTEDSVKMLHLQNTTRTKVVDREQGQQAPLPPSAGRVVPAGLLHRQVVFRNRRRAVVGLGGDRADVRAVLRRRACIQLPLQGQAVHAAVQEQPVDRQNREEFLVIC